MIEFLSEIKSAFELMKSKALQGENGLQDLKMALEQLQLQEEMGDRDQPGDYFTYTILYVADSDHKLHRFI